jgi:hypothetical protein
MNREQFFAVVSGLDEERLRKALWNLYWRGTANVRERIEVEPAGDGTARPPRRAPAPADPETVRDEVEDFVSLARAGALADWHALLLENLADTDGGPLERSAAHAALGGPEHTFLAARLAHRRGNADVPRDLAARCLHQLPGHHQFREFAVEIGATPPG